ncbi:MAG: sulfotransferase family 2 domain-containing protein [Verrucomicrobiota bacterium]
MTGSLPILEILRQIYIHIHIPKTGGTSLKSTLYGLFGLEGYGDTTAILNNYQYDRGQVERILRQQHQLRCLTGHKLSLDLPYESSEWTLRPFTFIRHPVDRFLSTYYFHHSSAAVQFETSRLSLDEFLDPANRAPLTTLEKSSQLAFLAGRGGEEGLQRVEACRFDHGLMLFPLEEMLRALCLLRSRFPEDFTGFQIHHLQQSKWDPPPTEAQQERIREIVHEDMRLYELSQETLAEAVRGLSEEELRYEPPLVRQKPLPVSVGLEKFGNIFHRLARSIEKRRPKIPDPDANNGA